MSNEYALCLRDLNKNQKISNFKGIKTDYQKISFIIGYNLLKKKA